MEEATIQKLREAHMALPEELRTPPATAEQLQAFEEQHSPIPDSYRWYLLECGGGVVGSEGVDSIDELSATHKKFKQDGWTMSGVFVIGWDGAGNPFGIELSTGRVLVEDHKTSEGSMRWHSRSKRS